ncbi:hypothetical protein RN001_009624 [Aquatica leii]|uniref:Glutathione S-transferase 1-like n=1 Tax=Aquatica leii TaxID=1421715 RepID=A0AAN7P6W3_9COLE|nr:hypothetical protein RN001_009624 [Aquatica leii]
MTIKLYYDDVCATSRAALLTVRALDLTIDLQEVNYFSKEQHPELIKFNTLGRLPVLIDEDLVICDSHVISGYLVTKYGNNSGLYSTDLITKALIDEKLYFNSNVLLPRLDSLLYPIILFGHKEIPKEKLYSLKEGYQILDTFLADSFLMGDSPTIADFACVASISTASIMLPVSSEIYPRLFKWYQKCKALPYYDKSNGVGLNKADALIENKLGSAYCKIIS